MTGNVLWRAAVLGAATGARSVAPLAALARSGDAGPWVGRLATVASVGEMVVDKLPGTASRLNTGPLLGRLALSAATAVVLSRRARVPALLPVVVAVAAAGAASLAGAAWRAAGARRNLSVPAALAEDAAAILLSEAGARR